MAKHQKRSNVRCTRKVLRIPDLEGKALASTSIGNTACSSHHPKRQGTKVRRILSSFQAHRLIAKLPCTRRWRITDRGKRIIAASLCLGDAAVPQLYKNAAAA